DPTQPLYNVRTLQDVVQQSVAQPRLNSTLLAAFALIGMLLAGLGIYGVVSHSVTQRTQEIGVRIALGARRSDVFGLVLREGAGLAALGVVIGLAGVALAIPFIRTWLFGIEWTDPATLGVTAGAVILVAIAASYFPARRAISVDPLIAIRSQ